MSHARPAARAVVLLAVAVAATLVAVGLPDLAAGRKKPAKPHLVFSGIEVKAPAFAFAKDETTFTLKYTVKNIGTAKSDQTRVELRLNPRPRQSPDIGIIVIDKSVPALRPGKEINAVKHGVFDSNENGAYKVFVCRHGRCSPERRFYVVEKAWVGELNGAGYVGSAAQAENWSSTDARLEFGQYLGHGAFRYDFNGPVTWTVRGTTTGGCNLAGHGSEHVDKNMAGRGIVLDYGNGFYKGSETLHDGFYTYTSTGHTYYCNGTKTYQGAPVNRTFLKIPKRPLGFDQQALTGSITAATQYDWSFEPAVG